MTKSERPVGGMRGARQSYSLIDAAIRWAGLTGLEPELGVSLLLPNAPFVKIDTRSKYPQLHEKYGLLIEATETGNLPYFGLTDHLLPEEERESFVKFEYRMVKTTDLKKWMKEAHPDDLPSFLFEREERGEKEKDLNESERRSLLLIIKGLALQKNVNLDDRYLVSSLVVMLEGAGFSLSGDTVRRHLQKAKGLSATHS